MKNLSLNLVSSILLFMSISYSWALSESDFYCLPVPFGGPGSFVKEAKTCSDPQGKKVHETTDDVCTEGARCMVLDDDMKKTKVGGVPLNELSPAAKLAYFQELYKNDYKREIPVSGPGMGDEWLMSQLVCKKDPTGACPLPENCKGDVLFNPKMADYDSFTTPERAVSADFVCLPAPSSPFGIAAPVAPAIFAKEVKTCTSAEGKITEVQDNICTELASCTFFDDKLKQTVISTRADGSKVLLGDLSESEQREYFKDSLYKHSDAMKDRWVVSDFACPKNEVSGRCPQPQNCKGESFLIWQAADYAHPAVDKAVDDAKYGYSLPVQHQKAGSAQ